MFVLGSEATLDVAKWWVSIDDSGIDKLLTKLISACSSKRKGYLQVSKVSSLAESVDPSSAESERSEVLLECVEEFSSTASSDLRRVVDAVVLDHVVRAIHVIVDVTLAS